MNELIISLLKEDIEYLKTFIKEANIELKKDLVLHLEAGYIDWASFQNCGPDYNPNYKPEFPDWLIATKQLLKNNKEEAAIHGY